MRRLLVLGGLLAALTINAAPAQAASSITLDSQADWSNAGTTVDLSGTATCTGGGIGTVTLQLRQGNRTGVGIDPPSIVCDGQPHSFADTVTGGPFQLGQARASATLTAPSGTATTSRTVTLV